MRKIVFLLAIIATITTFSACKKDPINDPSTEKSTIFSILGTINNAYYLGQTEDLGEGSFSFVNNGTQLDANQAARVIAAGDYMYSLNYGTGLLTQLEANASGGYDVVKEINAGLAVGTNRPRYKLADENTIMVYNVAVTAVKDSTNTTTDNINTLRLASIAIPSMTISNLTEFEIPQTANAQQGGTIGYEPMRVDAPVISGNKIYFGLMHLDMYDPSTPPPFRVPKQTGLETLVFDYPSFNNGTITESTASHGHTSGYRAPSMHVDEHGDVYQSNWYMTSNSFNLSNGDKTVITRLKNGTYDDSYVFNISDALGLSTNVGTVGWFYAGNGIGYMPIHLEDKGNYYTENSWSIAKIDLYNKTATLLNVPACNLLTLENGVVANDKFYLPVSIIGGAAAIYEFDPTVEGSDAFKVGLQLDGSNVAVQGAYITTKK